MDGEPQYTLATLYGNIITLDDNEEILRKASRDGTLRCPHEECGHAQMVYRNGGHYQPHFAHVAEGVTHDYTGETEDHRTVKVALGRYVKQMYPDAVVKTEFTTDPLRPDVYVKLADGREVALEVQNSHLSIDYMKDKIETFTDQEIHTIYVFVAGNGVYGKRPKPEEKMLRDLTDVEAHWCCMSNEIIYAVPDIKSDDIFGGKKYGYNPKLFGVRMCKRNPEPGWRRVQAYRKIDELQFRLFENDDELLVGRL